MKKPKLVIDPKDLIDGGYGLKKKKGLVLTSDVKYSDGSTYKGAIKSLKEPIPHGYGYFEYSDGKTYLGEWKNDEYHGQGTLKINRWKIIKGIWKNGKLIKK